MNTQTIKTLNSNRQDVAERLRILKDMEKAGDATFQDLEESLQNTAPLCLVMKKEVDIQLSFGGGSDGYKLYFDDSGVLVSGFYYFNTWDYSEQVELFGEELEKVERAYSSEIDSILYN